MQDEGCTGRRGARGRRVHSSAPAPLAQLTAAGGSSPTPHGVCSWCRCVIVHLEHLPNFRCTPGFSGSFRVFLPRLRRCSPSTGWTQQSRMCAQPSPARTDRDGWSRFQTTRTHRSAAFASMGAASVSRALSSDRAVAAAPWPGSIASVSTSGEDPPPTHAPSSAAITASSSTGSGAPSSRTTGAVPP